MMPWELHAQAHTHTKIKQLHTVLPAKHMLCSHIINQDIRSVHVKPNYVKRGIGKRAMVHMVGVISGTLSIPRALINQFAATIHTAAIELFNAVPAKGGACVKIKSNARNINWTRTFIVCW